MFQMQKWVLLVKGRIHDKRILPNFGQLISA